MMSSVDNGKNIAGGPVPLTIGQIWHVLKCQSQGWMVVFAVTAVVQVTFLPIQFGASALLHADEIDFTDQNWQEGHRWAFVIMWIIQHLNSCIAMTAILRAIAVMFSGHKASIRDCLLFTFSTWRALNIFGVQALFEGPSLIWTLIPHEIQSSTIASTGNNVRKLSITHVDGWDSFILFAMFLMFAITLLFLVGFLYVMSALYVYAPVIVVEDKSSLGSLVRSWKITSGHRWKILLFIVVMAVLTGLISLIFFAADNANPMIPFSIRSLVVTCILPIFTSPILATVNCMIYFHLRGHYECWNQQDLSRELALEPASLQAFLVKEVDIPDVECETGNALNYQEDKTINYC